MKKTLSRLIMAALAIASTNGFAQGPLTPPGTGTTPAGPVPPLSGTTPQASMKTLHQVEPRIDLNGPALAGVLSSDATTEIIISAPGSYYLSKNLAVGKTNGIQVNAAGVTIDLMGFEIARTAGAGGNGIDIAGTSHRCVVRNGNLRGFASGVFCVAILTKDCRFESLSLTACSGTALLSGVSARLTRCSVHDSQGAGISTGVGSVLEDCVVKDCTAATGAGFLSAGSSSLLTRCTSDNNTCTTGNGSGISAGDDCGLESCIATSNKGPAGICYGIFTGTGCVLRHCVASRNSGALARSFGISVGNRSQVLHCVAQLNTTPTPAPAADMGGGILLGAGCLAEKCTVYGNTGDGIRLSEQASVARGNVCSSNGNDPGNAAGIHATTNAAGCVIEDNLLRTGDRGLEVASSGVLITGNKAAGNTINYVIAANNRVATIVSPPNSAAISGSTGGGGWASTDPLANFAY